MESRTIIFHIDVNSAFLSWSAAYRTDVLGEKPDLRTVPSIVGGDQEARHGIVLAKSTPARKYGIQTGEPIVAARKKCPNLIIICLLYTSSLRQYAAAGRRTSVPEIYPAHL